MRPCTEEDFSKNGYARPLDTAVDKLICPDVESFGSRYRLFNGYKSKKSRVSVALEVIACNDDFTKGCKSDK